MAVKITDRKYTELYRPNEEFDFLLGNVGDWQKIKLKCEVASEVLANSAQTLSINTEEKTITLNSGGNWGEFGFDIGDQAVLLYTLVEDGDPNDTITQFQISFTIELIRGDTIEYSGGAGFEDIDYNIIPTDRGTERITNVRVFTEKEFQGTRITYGHVTNENVESNNLNSFIDGTTAEAGYVGLNTAPLNEWKMMEFFGLQSGMSLRSGRVRRVSNPNPLGATISRYNIPESSFSVSTLRVPTSNIDRPKIARVFPMTLTNAVADHRNIANGLFPSIIPVDNQGNLFDGEADQMFIQNAQNPFSNFYIFNAQFAIISSNSAFDGDSVALVLHRYNGGANYDPVERITLQRFNNTQSLVGQVIQVQVSRALFVQAGESYALALEYSNNDPDSIVSRRIDVAGLQGTIDIYDEIQDDFFKRFYEIELEYLISSFFDQPNDIIERQIPVFLEGDGSLTDNFNVRFFPEWNNPNTIVKNNLEETRRLGNTGWFDENFNQLDNDFEIESVIYKDLEDNVVQSLDYLAETIIEVRVNGIQSLDANSRFGFGFMWIPQNEEDYSDQETPFHQNTFIANGPYDQGFELTANPNPITFPGAGKDGAFLNVKDVHFRNENGILIFTARFMPNAAFASFFQSRSEEDRNYVLWLSVDDSDATARNFSNRVSLIADVDSLVENIPPAGPYPLATKFIEHPFTENNVGVDVYSGVVQDDILVRSRFAINKADNLTFQRMNFVIEMENQVTQERFELENFPVDLALSPRDSDGFQAFNVNQTRGFNLNQGNNKNFVKVIVDSDNPANNENVRNYIAFYGFKIRYEDWISRANVPASFFDENEGNDGLANDWYDYINTPNSDWLIKFSIYILADEGESIVLFRNTYNFVFNDYEQNDQVATEVEYRRDSDNQLLNIGNDPETGQPLGVILANELTRVIMKFTIQDSGTWTAGQVYGVTTLEIDRGAGIFEMYQLSSVYDREAGNPLIPLENENNLKLEIDGTEKILTTTCRIDPALLQGALRYRVTGRVGCFENQNNNEGGIYEPAYDSAYQ